MLDKHASQNISFTYSIHTFVQFRFTDLHTVRYKISGL
uniref:Uncharacterized protein n=1 Tax=Anguilla anguilla TaxID=7936 RepID=A0A0E9T2S8_ANGAN